MGMGGTVERLDVEAPVIPTEEIFAGQFRRTQLGRQAYLVEKPQAVVAGRALENQPMAGCYGAEPSGIAMYKPAIA